MELSSKKTKNASSSSIAVLGLVIICCLQSFAFAQKDNTFYNPSIGWIYNYVILLLAFLVLNDDKPKLGRGYFFIFVSLFFDYIFFNLHSYGKGNVINSLFTPIVLSIFCLTSNTVKADAYLWMKRLFMAMSLYGVIVYILYISGVLSPFSIVDFYEKDSSIYYVNYLFSYLTITPFGVPRLCGLFNEPGMFGTIGALILIAERMKITKGNVLIFISCIFSFSLSFYVLILIYYFLKALSSFKIQYFIVVIGIIGLVVYLTTVEFQNDAINLFVNRFTFEDGSFVGDNRASEDLDLIWEEVTNNPDKLLWGVGRPLGHLGSSYKQLIIKHGIVGVSFIYLPFIIALISICRKDKDCSILAACFLASIYQRPLIFSLTYFVVLFGGIQYIKRQKRNEEIHNKELESSTVVQHKQKKRYAIRFY